MPGRPRKPDDGFPVVSLVSLPTLISGLSCEARSDMHKTKPHTHLSTYEEGDGESRDSCSGCDVVSPAAPRPCSHPVSCFLSPASCNLLARLGAATPFPSGVTVFIASHSAPQWALSSTHPRPPGLSRSSSSAAATAVSLRHSTCWTCPRAEPRGRAAELFLAMTDAFPSR